MSRLTILAAGAGLTLLPSPPTLGAPASPTAGPAPRVHKVVIDKMKFGPVPAGIRAGDTILWINRDMFRHTATARDKSFNIDLPAGKSGKTVVRSEEHTSELQSLMRISYAVFCLKKK